MTVSTEVDHNEYTGNGVTTSFPYTFRIFNKSDLVVQVVDLDENITVLALDTDYTVTGAGGYAGGNVILTSALTNGYQISISRELPVTQETDLRNQGKFFAEVHEDAFDKLTMLVQQVRSYFSLALRKPSFVANYYDAMNNYIRNLRDPRNPQDAATKNYVDTLASGNLSRTLRVPEPIPQLPDAATRANKIPAFDSAGNPIVVLPPSGSASDVLIELAKPTGSTLIGHEGHTVGQYLDGVGKMVFPGDDLKAALESANNGDTVIVSGDVTLTQPVVISKAVNIKRVNAGRILWSGTGAAIRYILAVKNTITTPTQFLRSQNTATLPEGHGVVVGDMLELHSTQVRYADVDGDYTFGQFIYVEKVDGNTITFQPSMTTGFTTSEIIVSNSLEGMQFDVEIINIKPATGSANGILLDIHGARNLTGKFRIIGNGDENYGLALQGYHCKLDVDVWNIKSGNFSVPGYGYNVVGDSIYTNLSGGNCRHVGEIPARNVVSNDIHFHCNITKTLGTPLYIYNVGWHSNVIYAKLTGTISGSGMLVGVRSGSGEVSMEFNGADDGYDYADVVVGDMYPTSLKIHGCHSGGVNARRSLVQWNVKGQGSNAGGLIVDNNTTVGPKRIIRLYDDSGSTTKAYRVYLSNNKGAAVAIHNRDLLNANVYLEINNNTWSSYGLANFSEYMAGVDKSGCKTYEVRSTNNNIDDSVTSGLFSFDGYMDAIVFSSQGDKNSNRPFLKLTPTYLGRVDRLDINGLNTNGQMTLTPLAATVYNDIGQIRFCRIGYDSNQPIVVGLSWPIVYTGNSFKTTLDATLVSTKRPQAGNVNLSGKALNWNGTNIAI